MAVQLTEIQEEAPDVPRLHLKPVKLAEVEALPIETFVDVIAVLDSCQDLGLIQRRDGSEGKKRSLVVRDDSSRSIEVTLWGEKADTPGAELFELARSGQHPVLVIKSAAPPTAHVPYPFGLVTRIAVACCGELRYARTARGRFACLRHDCGRADHVP